MVDYKLSGLSSGSFEKLTQALTLAIFGPNSVIFGDGPDGGREATFDGPVPYLNKNGGWNGYGVVQAKFKQRPEDPRRDGEWELEQLRSELSRYSGPAPVGRKPEYYIFVTNVVLTAVRRRGFRDKVDSVFKQFKEDIPLKGYDVWDYEKICRFLDAHEDIRRAYGAWITPGDVLAEVMSSLALRTKDFDAIITNFIQKDFILKQFVNLEQAGHVVDDRIPIARVFVDLPCSERFEPSDDKSEKLDFNSEGESIGEVIYDQDYDVAFSGIGGKEGVVNKLIRAGAESYKPYSSVEYGRRPGRYVLIGGPGTGEDDRLPIPMPMFPRGNSHPKTARIHHQGSSYRYERYPIPM